MKFRKGFVFIWNSMNFRGECDFIFFYNVVKVIKGYKFII